MEAGFELHCEQWLDDLHVAIWAYHSQFLAMERNSAIFVVTAQHHHVIEPCTAPPTIASSTTGTLHNL